MCVDYNEGFGLLKGSDIICLKYASFDFHMGHNDFLWCVGRHWSQRSMSNILNTNSAYTFLTNGVQFGTIIADGV